MRRLSLGVVLLLAIASCTSDPTSTFPQFSLQQTTTITADKTAEGKITKTFPWTIEKTVTPAALELFRGDIGTSAFTVTATRGDSVNVISVAGEVCVTNTGSEATENLTIEDRVQVSVSGGDFQDVSGASVTIVPETQVAAGQTECYPYEIPFDTVSDAVYRNVANVTITNLEGSAGTPSGPEVILDFSIPGDVTGEANRSVTVEDSNEQSWTFDDTGSQTYEVTYTCDDDAGENVNTATILETGDEATASVTVACYALNVSKTAVTEFTRTWVWSLEKTSEVAQLIVPAGFPFAVDYVVTPSATAVDGDAMVSGTITISNPAPLDAKLLSVADIAEGDIALTVTCPDVTFPLTLAPDGTLECTYEGALPDLTTRSNVASAELQNVTYDAAGTATETGTTTFSGSAEISFGDPTTILDTCIDITDDQAGALGTVCVSELPATFAYSADWGPFQDCGAYDGVNTASFTTSNTAATGSVSWTVQVTVPCGPDCTFSQGYWKNHSEHGPAKYDDTWAFLASGADTPFFDTGMSWLDAMRRPPRGNAYFILAKQYAAAWLNGLHGANVSEVAAQIQRAADLLDEYDGDPLGMDMITGSVRAEFVQLGELLDDFNNGRLGTGKCD